VYLGSEVLQGTIADHPQEQLPQHIGDLKPDQACQGRCSSSGLGLQRCLGPLAEAETEDTVSSSAGATCMLEEDLCCQVK